MKAFLSSISGAMLAAAMLFSAPAGAQQDQQDQMKPSGEVAKSLAEQAKTADQVALLNQKAIALSSLALQKSQSPEVRDYAQKVMSAHQANLSALKDWSAQKRVEVATAIELYVPEQGVGGSGELDPEQKQKLDEQLQKYSEAVREQAKAAQSEILDLAKLEGKDFDEKYLSTVISDQKDAASTTEKAQKDFAADTTFAALMGSTTRTLKQLNDQGEQVKKQIKG